MTCELRARGGSALIAAIVVLLILECVVLGTLHLAFLETRLADNAEASVRLRMAAQTAAHATLAAWTAAMERLRTGETHEAAAAGSEGLVLHVRTERLAGSLYLVRADARQPPPLHGRAAVALLATPPPLPPGFVPVAALSAGVTPTLTTTAQLLAGTAGCDRAGAALELPEWASLHDPALAGVDAIVLAPAGADAAVVATRVVEALRTRRNSAVLFVDGDFTVSSTLDTILVVSGRLEVAAGATLRGLVIAGGELHIEPGATVSGAVVVAGMSTIGGRVELDLCTFERLPGTSALRRARLLRARSTIPAF